MKQTRSKIEKILQASIRFQKGNRRFIKTEISRICRLFNISRLPESLFTSDTCWLAGGSVLAWLSGGSIRGEADNHDRDFFFPTRQALLATLVTMLKQKFQIYRFHLRKRRFIKRTYIHAADIGISTIIPKMIVENPKFIHVLSRPDLVVVQLQSSTGIVYQLVAAYTGREPAGIIQQFDYSICQLAIDGKYLYAGPDTWHDIMHRKLRITHLKTNIQTAARCYKFMKMGYHPTGKTAAAVIKSILFLPVYICR
ncbi:MAG: hypothetical protein H8E17_11370 [Deltaproteobacteria bacterium]|nr:hypothetical protein [Deltaproteobacteria bacterium]